MFQFSMQTISYGLQFSLIDMNQGCVKAVYIYLPWPVKLFKNIYFTFIKAL